MVRSSLACWLWCLAWTCAACTPEAIEVDPGRGGSTMMGQGGSAGECAPISSPRPGCTECLQRECGKEISDCAGTDCACGAHGDQRGQVNCLLACPTLGAKLPDACAQDCGFGSLRDADPRTVALWECLVVPPSGPPACKECIDPP